MNDDLNRDLTGALRALESNNKIIPPEEKEKRAAFLAQQSESASSSLIHPLRTFEGDAAEFIKNEQQSLYTIQKAAKAKQKPAAPVVEHTHEGRNNAILLFLSIILFLAGCSFALYFFLLRDTVAPPIKTSIAPTSIIQAEVTTEVAYDPLNGSSLSSALQNAIASKQNNPNDVEYIRLIENNKPVPLDAILINLVSPIPGSLLRALNKTNYMIGTIQQETKKPFFIAHVDYYDNAFAGMLQFEPAMSNFFNKIIPSDNTVPLETAFSDDLVKNKDVRVLRDTAGNAHIIYSFYDKQTLLITTDETAVMVLINALTSAKIAH